MILQSASLQPPTYRYNPGIKGNPPNDTLPVGHAELVVRRYLTSDESRTRNESDINHT